MARISLIASLISIMLPLAGCAFWMLEKPPARTVQVQIQGKKFSLLPKKLFVFPDVYLPDEASLHILRNTRIDKGDEVLDLGTGTGIQAIFAAKKAGSVIATDIESKAIENARYNVRYHGLDDKIEVRPGDLFEPVGKGERFDVIIFSMCLPKERPLETGRRPDGLLMNQCWNITERFFKEAGGYLKDEGRIYYMTGFAESMPHAKKVIASNNLVIKDSHTRLYYNEDLTVFEIVKH